MLDVYSRRVVGWAIDMRQTTKLVLNAPAGKDWAVTDEHIVGRVQHLLRSVAGAEEWLQVVTEIQQRHPAIADMVRAYGLARTDDAVAHWQRHR